MPKIQIPRLQLKPPELASLVLEWRMVFLTAISWDTSVCYSLRTCALDIWGFPAHSILPRSIHLSITMTLRQTGWPPSFLHQGLCTAVLSGMFFPQIYLVSYVIYFWKKPPYLWPPYKCGTFPPPLLPNSLFWIFSYFLSPSGMTLFFVSNSNMTNVSSTRVGTLCWIILYSHLLE